MSSFSPSNDIRSSPPPCRLCSGGPVEVLFDAGWVPVSMNVTLGSQAEALAAPKGLMLMGACLGCGFVQNVAHDGEGWGFGAEYGYRQGISEVYGAHLDAVAGVVCEGLDRGARVLEVGCGAGALVDRLGALGLEVKGVDPSYGGEDRRIERRAFRVEDAEGVEVVVLRHVLDEVGSPWALLKQLGGACGRARVVVEVLDGGRCWREGAFEDLVCERVGLFCRETLEALFEGAACRSVLGGQNLLVEAPLEGLRRPVASVRWGAEAMEGALEAVRRVVEGRSGELVVWGASTKGGRIVGWADPERVHVRGLVDIDPGRWGRFMPVSGHVVMSPEVALAGRPGGILVANPVYLDEVRAMVDDASIEVFSLQRAP